MRSSTTTGVLVALIATALVSAPASADGDADTPVPSLTPAQLAEQPAAEWYAINSASGNILSSEDEIVPELEASPDGDSPSDSEATPFLIDDPAAWTACFVQRDESYPLRSYTWWTETGPKIIQLQCGYHNSTTGGGTGWHHIAAGHEQQWRNRIIQTGGSTDGAGWDDLMAWQIQETMDRPYVNIDKINGKRCVGAPTMMFDGDGDYVYTFYPTTIFTEDSKIVITSIPGSNYTC